MADKWYTCRDCQVLTKYPSYLDNKPICYQCLDERLYGAARRLCAARGYHETVSTQSDCPQQHANYTATFYLRIKCACGEEVDLEKTVAAGPIEGSSLLGYEHPIGPSRWGILEGQVVDLSEA